MLELLAAGFHRLWRNKPFWIASAFITLGSVVMNWLNYGNEEEAYIIEMSISAEDVLFSLFPLLGFVCVMFISLFLGADYEYGTLRNKLIVGRTRGEIYFAHAVVCGAASLLLMLGMLLCSGICGYLIIGHFFLSVKELLFLLLCCVLIALAYTGLCVAVTMTTSSRAVSVIAAIILMFALTYGGAWLQGALREPEKIYDHIIISAEGGVEFGELIDNPAYVSGTQRVIYEFIYDFLPTGQAAQLNNVEFDRCLRWPWLSALFASASLLAGWLGFRRRDIK